MRESLAEIDIRELHALGAQEGAHRDEIIDGIGDAVELLDVRVEHLLETRIEHGLEERDFGWLMRATGRSDPDEQIGVPEALAGAGINGISQMTGAGGKVNYSYIKAGLSTVDASQPPTFSAWALVDAAARALDHQRIRVAFFPMEFLTKAQLTFNISQEWPDVPNFEKKFEGLWRARPSSMIWSRARSPS